MRKKNSTKVLVVLLVLLLALLVSVMIVSAAESSGIGSAVAALEVGGQGELPVFPVEGIDFQPISPWHIDATSIGI